MAALKPDHEADASWQKECEDAIGKGVGAASESDLEAINRYTLAPVTADDVFCGKMKLCNDQYDRADERFPKSYLQRFAETLPGKSVMRGHDYRSEPVGRFYDASVEKQDGVNHVIARYYLAADGPVTPAVRMGIAKGVSIGFQPDIRTCDLCSKDYDGWYKARAQADDEPCSHIRGRTYDGKKCTLTYGGDLTKVEAQEGSFVWLGCQFGAETTRGTAVSVQKAAHFDALETTSGKGDTMDEKEKAAAAAREKELTAEIDRLKPLAGDGEAYRKWQKSEITRLYASMGEEAAGAALVKALDLADAGSLDAVRTEADKRHAVAFQQPGAQVGTGDAEKTGELPRRTRREILFGEPGRVDR